MHLDLNGLTPILWPEFALPADLNQISSISGVWWKAQLIVAFDREDQTFLNTAERLSNLKLAEHLLIELSHPSSAS